MPRAHSHCSRPLPTGEGLLSLNMGEWVRGSDLAVPAVPPLTPTLFPKGGEGAHRVCGNPHAQHVPHLSACSRERIALSMHARADTGAPKEQAMRVEEVLNQSPPYVDIDLYASDRPLADAVAANG